MLLMLVFSPLMTLAEISIGFGHILIKVLMQDLYDTTDRFHDNKYVACIVMMGLSCSPIILSACCLIYPVVFVCRLWQILKIFLFKIAGHCLRRIFCCFCCCN